LFIAPRRDEIALSCKNVDGGNETNRSRGRLTLPGRDAIRTGVAGEVALRSFEYPQAPDRVRHRTIREKMMRTAWVMKHGVMAAIALAASTGPGLAQDATNGEAVFKRLCSPCHSIGPDAAVKLGPPLNGVDGRTAGTFEGFNYSQANKSSGITWGHDAFAKYIRAPMQEMPGTRMAFVGIKNDKDIEDLWAYLSEFKPDGSKK
jgi:cytochrome c